MKSLEKNGREGDGERDKSKQWKQKIDQHHLIGIVFKWLLSETIYENIVEAII